MERTSFGPLRESAPTADVLEYIPKAERDKIPDEDFAGPSRTFPINSQAHVDAAARLIGHAANPEAVKRKIIAIAKRKGFKLPDAWKEDEAKESAFAPALLGKSRIATLTTCWLEDDAVSLNGRQYPRSAVDRLLQSAQVQLSDPNSAPLTCYISHEAADQDDSLKLVGKITRVWRDGVKAMANIDLANTHAGRDVATLAHEGYLRTQSLRASNAEIQRPKDSTWPVVGGSSLKLDGIDFTATPGISVAKIQSVALAENAREGPQRLHEVFNAKQPLVEVEEHAPMTKLNEGEQGGNMVGGYAPTSGNSPSVDGAPSQGAYGQRMYQAPEMTSGPMQGMDNAGRDMDLVEAHDRIAMVQGRSCAPQRESARWNNALKTLLFEGLTSQERRLIEAGRAINAQNNKHLDVVHDTMARKTGMACEGKQNKMGAAQPANDGMQDGDDDDLQSARPQGSVKEQQQPQQNKEQEMPATPEEAAKILEAAGWKLEKPKTAEEHLQERLDAVKAEQAAQLEALKAEQAKHLEEQQKRLEEQMRNLVAQATPDPQRRSMVLGSNVSEANNGQHRPLRGKYLQEKIKSLDWERMANDRLSPLPTDVIPLDLLMREFEHMYALSYDDWAKRVYNIAPIYDANH